MAKHIIEAYFYEHAGTINRTAKSKVEALRIFSEIKSTVLKQLNASRNTIAVIWIFSFAFSKPAISSHALEMNGVIAMSILVAIAMVKVEHYSKANNLSKPSQGALHLFVTSGIAGPFYVMRFVI